MILCDESLKKLCHEKKLITPYIADNIQPASIDLRLGDEFLKINSGYRQVEFGDTSRKTLYHKYKAPTFKIGPHQFILATTIETVKIPHDCAAFVQGRSSIGRMGLFIQNAGWVDPGFQGQITLELYNASPVPIVLEAGRRICQLIIAKLDNTAVNPYRGKYQNQIGVRGSEIWKDKEVGE